MNAHFIEFIKQVEEKRKKCEAWWAFFLQRVNKFNNTAARMFDFIYHMTLLLKICILA